MTAALPRAAASSGDLTAEVIAATECAEDLLCLWREQRRLAHRIRLAQLRFELIGLAPEEQDQLTDEVADWKRLVWAFADTRRAA